MSSQPNEILGNKWGASNLMKIEYCGGWGYRKYAVALIEEIEKVFGAGQFIYHLHMDEGVTGRLEVTVFPGSKTETDHGKLVHSKKASGAYIHADYPAFFAALEEAMKWFYVKHDIKSHLSPLISLSWPIYHLLSQRSKILYLDA